MVLGVIGGIGSGKTTVLSILKEEYGALILEADKIGKELQQPGRKGFDAMISLMGTDIVSEDGTLDRARIAEKIFRDQALLTRVNGVIHPLVRTEIEKQIAVAPEGSLVVLESAILREAGMTELCDEILFVYAEKEARITRLMKERGYSKKKCLSIMGKQASEKENRAICGAVIDNSGDLAFTRVQIHDFMKKVR